MASSPDNAAGIARAADPESLFRRALKDLDDRLLRGEPFSGHERNCAFLNTGSGRWATVSHISGFDFDDDARSLAATDWDADGDVDVWISNRTAPMVRYLRNDIPRGGDYLALQLAQDSGNRHAIGARVEVKVVGSTRQLLVREVRAGDSYLSQSSLRLHFGLGNKAQIAGVTVRWPGGSAESFSGVQPNAAWRLRKGTGRADVIAPRAGLSPVKPGPVALPPGELPVVVPLAHPVPLPRIDFTNLSARQRRLDEFKGAPVFLTLVSGGAEACAAQFAALRPHLEDLKSAGIALLAGGMDDTPETRALLESLPAHFEKTILDSRARERLAEIYHLPFEIRLRLSAPAGFTLNSDLRVITIYRGAATAEQLHADVKRAGMTPEQLSASAMPFAGQWFRAPAAWPPLELFSTLVRQNDPDAAHSWISQNRAAFAASRRFSAVARVMADLLTNLNRPADALPYYRDCEPEHRSDPVFQNNFAHCLLHQPRPDRSAIDEAVQRAGEAVKLTSRSQVAMLDTLAHALAAAGRKEDAVTVAREGLGLSGSPPEIIESLTALVEGR